MPITGGTTPTDMLETVNSKIGFKSAQTEILTSGTPQVINEVINSKFGLSSAISVEVYLGGGSHDEVVNSRLGFFVAIPSVLPPVTYNEAPAARFGLQGYMRDYNVVAETILSSAGLRTSQSDILITTGGNQTYYENPRGKLGFRSTAAGQLIATDTGSGIKGRLGLHSAGASLSVLLDTPLSRLGMRTGGTDQHFWAATAASLLGVRAGTVPLSVYLDTANSRDGFRAATATQALVTLEPTSVHVGFRTGLSADQVIVTVTSGSRLALSSSPIIQAIYLDAVRSIAAMRSALLDSAVLASTVNARLALRATSAELLVKIESIGTRLAFKAAATETVVVVESPRSRIGMRSSNSRNGSGGLVPAIRYHVMRSLPEITATPEGLPSARWPEDIQAPYVAIIVQEPTPLDGFAVQDQAVDVQVDICLVQATVRDGSTDQTQDIMRPKMETLRRALLADYQMFGAAEFPSCIDTQTVATPMERAGVYEQEYATENQDIQVLCFTMVFTVVDNLAGAGY